MKNYLKKSVAVVVCAGMLAGSGIYAAPVFAAESQETMTISSVKKGNAYIPGGTILKIELAKELSSKTAKVGDPVQLRIVENLIINDVVVIPSGTRVKGVVTKARKSGALGRGGKLEFSIVSVDTLNGVTVPLEYTKGDKKGGDGGAVAVFALVSVVGGLFMKGKNVVYNEGLQFDAEVSADVDLNVPLNGLKAAMDTSKPRGTSITIR